MDPLDFLTEEEMIDLLRRNKTEISYIQEPHIFLDQLQRHDLIPENVYKKVLNMQESVYEILDWLENKKGQYVKKFWRCVFQDHMLKEYPIFGSLRNSLEDGSFKNFEKLPKAEKPRSNKGVKREKKEQEQKKGATKRKKSGEKTKEEKPGPSSVSSQKKTAMKPTFFVQTRRINSSQMDPLDFLTEEEMITFFHSKKTEISCMEEPHTFLNQLRDYDLVSEDLYKKVISMRSKERREKGVYKILDLLENEKGPCIKMFWRCVFQDHMLQKYPTLCSLRNSILDGSFRNCEKVPNAEKPRSNKEIEKEKKKQEQKKGATKRKKTGKETDEKEPGPSSVSSRKKPAMKPTFSLLLKRGALPVTCGDKKGTLYRDKLAKGEDCILSQGHWFTPCDFERISGKGSSKNWKLSIRCQNTTLQKLIKEGHLQCPRTYGRKVTRKRVTLPSVSVEISRPWPISSIDTDESRNDLELWLEENSEQQDDEEHSEPVNLSKFQALSFPVSCGSVRGVLYKSRFAGSLSKSIRTEESWFTPEEFIQQELTLTDRHWKTDILCHGKTLNYLLKKQILHIHSLMCSCRLCHPKNKWDQDNDDVCYICNSKEKLVFCDECPRAFHHHCHLPALQQGTLGNKWMCTYCVLKANQRLWIHMSRKGALSSPVSGNIMRCEYLLLFLYKADTQHVFTSDPTKREARYSSVSSKPMWLNKVKTKLQKNKYRTVRQFVHNIKLIFNNCQTFYKDNKYGRMAAKINKKFEKEFKTVFKIQ